MATTFGIDLIFETQRGNIRSENDVLMIIVHWILCKNNYRCVGIGDNKIFSDEDRPTELLPQGWNQDQSSYALRYTLNKQIYILYGIVSDDTLLVNFLDGKTLKTVGLVFKTKEVVKSKTGISLDDYINDSQSIINRMTNEIVNPLANPEPAAAASSERPRNTDPLLVRPPRPTGPPIFDPRADPLFGVGRGDLDPFGRGGGMIFDPLFRPNLNPVNPNHPIPPGARYDPPNPFRRLDPDNDHLRPPPGYDDMFM